MQDRCADEGFFEPCGLGRGGGLGGALCRGRGKGDLEIEFGQEWSWEVGVPVTAFEDDAVEFVLGDGDGPVVFLLAAAGEAVQRFGVEERYPAGLARGSPMLKDEQDALGVVDAGVLGSC